MKINNVLFCRNTHDEHGKFREELYGVQCDCAGLGVHALDTGKPLTLGDFIAEHRKYAADWNEEVPSTDRLLDDLAAMIRAGLVVVKYEYAFQECES